MIDHRKRVLNQQLIKPFYSKKEIHGPDRSLRNCSVTFAMYIHVHYNQKDYEIIFKIPG